MNKDYTVRDLERELRVIRINRKLGDATIAVLNFINEYQELIFLFGPLVIGGIATVVKSISQYNKVEKMRELKEERIYDRSLGLYWNLKRKLKNDEMIQINESRKQGAKLGDILNEMNLLK